MGRFAFLALTGSGLLFLLGSSHSVLASATPGYSNIGSLPSISELVPGIQETKGDQKATAKTSSIALPDGDGKALTQKTCSGCHSTDVFAKQRHDLQKWNQILDNMVSKGMMASDDDLDKIANYLATNLGPDSSHAAGSQTAPNSNTRP